MPVVIDEICLAPTSYHNGQANSYSYSAKCSVIESDDWPVDDEVPKQFDVTSAPLTPLEKESCTANLKVGDSDVVLYQPGKRKKTMQLFGFMGLQPGHGLVKIEDHQRQPISLMKLIDCVMLIGLVGLLFLALYLADQFTFIEPAAFVWKASLVGGILLGGGFAGYVVFRRSQEKKKLHAKNELAIENGQSIEMIRKPRLLADVVLVVGAIYLFSMTSFFFAISLNGILDNSGSKMTPVEIVSVDEEKELVTFRFTQAAVQKGAFWEGEFKCQAADGEIGLLIDKKVTRGLVDVRQGAFGWKWVRAVHPAPPEAPQ